MVPRRLRSGSRWPEPSARRLRAIPEIAIFARIARDIAAGWTKLRPFQLPAGSLAHERPDDRQGFHGPRRKPADADVDPLVSEITKRLTYSLGKDPSVAQNHDWLTAGILALRDRIIDCWRRSTKESYAQGRKRVYYLSLEFLIGRSFARRAQQSAADGDDARRRWRSWASISTRSSRSSPTPRSAMAASAGWRPASWRAWRPSASRAWATASATTTACSASRSSTAGRSSCPRTGSPSAIPGSSSAARAPTRSASAAPSKRHVQDGSARVQSGSRARRVFAVAYDTPVVGWRGSARQHAAAVARAGRRPDPPRRLQRRRPHRRAAPSATRPK